MILSTELDQVQVDHVARSLDPDGQDSIGFLEFKLYFLYEV